MRRETGRDQVVKVHHDEGVANRPFAVRCLAYAPLPTLRSCPHGTNPHGSGSHLFWTPTLLTERKASGRARHRERPLVRRGRSPWRVRKLSVSGNQEFSCLAGQLSPQRQSVSERLGAVAGDGRTREVTLCPPYRQEKRRRRSSPRSYTKSRSMRSKSAQARGPDGSISGAAEPAGLYSQAGAAASAERSPRWKRKSSKERRRC